MEKSQITWLGPELSLTLRVQQVEAQLAKAEEKLRIAVEALKGMAAYDKHLANQILVHDKSYGGFDEPEAVKTSRTAIQRIAALEQIEQQEKAAM